MDFLTEKIYNTYLKVSRTQNNKPFRYRKNFEGFESEKNYLPVLRLKNFFSRHPQINMEDYFLAPYAVFAAEKDSFYDLSFYNSQQAVKVYTMYTKKCMMEDPDSELQLNKIREGLIFIKNFCVEKGITLQDYTKHKTEKVHDFLIHLGNKQISIYNLFPLKNVDEQLKHYDFELLSFILKDMAARISYFRTKFYASEHAKSFCAAGLKKIEKAIKITLDNPKKHITI